MGWWGKPGGSNWLAFVVVGWVGKPREGAGDRVGWEGGSGWGPEPAELWGLEHEAWAWNEDPTPKPKQSFSMHTTYKL